MVLLDETQEQTVLALEAASEEGAMSESGATLPPPSPSLRECAMVGRRGVRKARSQVHCWGLFVLESSMESKHVLSWRASQAGHRVGKRSNLEAIHDFATK